MSDADSDDVPLAQREVAERRLSSLLTSFTVDEDATFGGGGGGGDEDDLPDWMKKHKVTTPVLHRPMRLTRNAVSLPAAALSCLGMCCSQSSAIPSPRLAG